jgi:hypothetical protein
MVLPVHDLAVRKIQAPKKVELTETAPAQVARIRVQIQNRSPHAEMVPNLASLGEMVTVTLDSLGDCPDLTATPVVGSAQPALPLTVASKGKVNLWFEVAVGTACVNDPLRNAKGSIGHEDYAVVVSVDHAAIDGSADLHPSDDVCPRSVAPPFVVDPWPDGSIRDNGCGAQKGDGTFGDPVLVDLHVRG